MVPTIDIKKLGERFLGYADSYQTGDADDYGYVAKRDHTMRVYENARQIALAAGVDEETLMVIEATAILHDVGRFEEWRRYKSYKRKKEFDHAKEGANFLRQGLIKKMIPETRMYDDLIILAVDVHGDMLLPDNLDERERTICDIIRDADRIDIFYLCTRDSDFDRMYNQEVGEKFLTQCVKENFKAGKPINIFDLRNKLDVLALELGLMKQLTTKASKLVIIKNNLVNRMVDVFKAKLPYYDEKEVEWLREEINEYLKRNS